MNLILLGNSGSGKTSAIKKILQHFDEPIYGYWTEKLVPDEDGTCPVVMHGNMEPFSFQHLIGSCKDHHAMRCPEVFDEAGVRFLSGIPEGSLVLMDEIGFMEDHAEKFKEAIFRILDGNYRVIAAVRDKETTLLNQIRNHPKSHCIPAGEVRTDEAVFSCVSLLQKNKDLL